LGTIVVGVLAVVVSAIFNLATLQRSGRQFQLAAFDVAPFSLDDPPDRSEFERTARAALLVVDVYRRISGHAFAINMLTDDRGNTARVNRTHQEISADRQEVEATLEPKTRAPPSEATSRAQTTSSRTPRTSGTRTGRSCGLLPDEVGAPYQVAREEPSRRRPNPPSTKS
jgi:hypothetical protein